MFSSYSISCENYYLHAFTSLWPSPIQRRAMCVWQNKKWKMRCNAKRVRRCRNNISAAALRTHLVYYHWKLHENKCDVHANVRRRQTAREWKQERGQFGDWWCCFVFVSFLRAKWNEQQEKLARRAYINYYPNMCSNNSWMHQFPVLLRASVTHGAHECCAHAIAVAASRMSYLLRERLTMRVSADKTLKKEFASRRTIRLPW